MVLNSQRAVRVSPVLLQRFLARVQRALHLPRQSVTVCLLGDAQMARLNGRYRGKRGPTDVLAFPAAGARGRKAATRDPYLGDIAIAPRVARQNARRFGRTVPDELRILILHGVLHLMGYDHVTDGGQMERYEARLRRRLGLS
jgi:probable rRNA maturation factor